MQRGPLTISPRLWVARATIRTLMIVKVEVLVKSTGRERKGKQRDYTSTESSSRIVLEQKAKGFSFYRANNVLCRKAYWFSSFPKRGFAEFECGLTLPGRTTWLSNVYRCMIVASVYRSECKKSEILCTRLCLTCSTCPVKRNNQCIAIDISAEFPLISTEMSVPILSE